MYVICGILPFFAFIVFACKYSQHKFERDDYEGGTHHNEDYSTFEMGDVFNSIKSNNKIKLL